MIKNKSYFIVSMYFSLLLLLIIYRITIGVDLSDESYYATFLDGWLKLGVGHSANLMLHQTAAWLVFPFASMYHWLVGSALGIILFLRLVYVCFSFLGMYCFFCFSKRIAPFFLASLVSGVVFLFIPWSLPSVSYNTIGMLGMLMALCLFGIAITDLEKTTHKSVFFTSSFFCAVAVIAYPTLIAVLFFLFIAVYFFLNDRKVRQLLPHYVLSCFLMLAFLSILLVLTFGFNHMTSMLAFTNAANHVSDGFGRKLAMMQNLFAHNRPFFSLSLLAIILGIAKTVFYRNLVIDWCSYLFLAGVFYFCLFTEGRVLFLYSHDFIFILALAGIYIPLQTIFYRSYPPIVAILYCTSLFAGLITTITAYNHLFNFHIGGLLAAALSLLFITSNRSVVQKRYFFLTFISLVGANVVMLASDYRYIYGELLNPLQFPAARIKNGAFSGLLTTSSKKTVIDNTQEILSHQPAYKSLVVLGPNSGAYLLTSLQPKALATWNWGALNGDAVEKLINNFYAIKNNQPDFILKYTDQWTLPLNKAEQSLIKNYYLVKEIKNPETQFQLYMRI